MSKKLEETENEVDSYPSDFESEEEPDEDEDMAGSKGSRRTSKTYHDVEQDIYVRDIVKKSGCETFVINFAENGGGKARKVVKKNVRPATTSRLKVKPKGIDPNLAEVNTSKVSEKRLRSAFAFGRPKKQRKDSVKAGKISRFYGLRSWTIDPPF